MLHLGKCYCKETITTPVTKYTKLDAALRLELRKIVDAITAPGKGLLASDESPASLDKRFEELGIENTETARRDYRLMLFSADKKQLSQYISGIILHHETVYQQTPDYVDMIEFLRQRCIVPGVKVDKGTVDLFGSKGESTTQGLDSLQERCIQYKRDGCHFTKWRCEFQIRDMLPSQLSLTTNAHTLARYASICQSARMVPIVEPEVLTDGSHDINKALEVHEDVLTEVIRALHEHHVYLEGMILKISMVLPGRDCLKTVTPQLVAENTVTAMERTVPPAIPAVVFLSGGQSDEDSVINLNAINLYEGRKPWRLSFCYGRSLQNAAMKVWKGDPGNVPQAQAIFLERAKLCSEAALGKLTMD